MASILLCQLIRISVTNMPGIMTGRHLLGKQIGITKFLK